MCVLRNKCCDDVLLTSILVAILEVDTASHRGIFYAAEGENILYFTIEMIKFSLLKFFGSVSELICG